MPEARPSIALLAVGGLSCVLLVVGAVGTWQIVDVNTFGFNVHESATGVEHGSDGPIVIGMAVIAAAMLLCYLLVPGLPVWAPIVALVIAVLALLTSTADTIDVAGRSFRTPGWGLYLDLAASIALTVATALLVREALLHGRAVRAARPIAPWPAQQAIAPQPQSASAAEAAAQPAQPAQAAAQPAQPVAASPPGWHADPWGQKRLRYWDGAQWTGHTAD